MKMMRHAYIGLVGLASLACDAQPASLADATPTGFDAQPDAQPPPPRELTAALLFSDQFVPAFELELSPLALQRLDEDPFEYVCGAVHYQETRYPNVGIKLKGARGGSFRSLSRKAAFKLKFNTCGVDGRRFFGLKSVTLNNLVQDRTMLHEWVAYQLFRAVGLPAPRASYATVTVNQVPYGLYMNVEAVDDVFLQRNFSDPTGSLYEGEFGTDLRTEDLWNFQQDEGADVSRADLDALIAITAADSDELFFGPRALLDVDRFVTFVAAEGVVGQWDGYWKAHNYRLYHEPATDQWSFLPWGMDQTLLYPTKLFAPIGLATQKCFAYPRCLALYVDALARVMDSHDQLDFSARIERISSLISEAIEDDPRRPYSASAVASAQRGFRHMLAERTADLTVQLACLASDTTADADMDGALACIQDCDDGQADVHPDAIELCDGLDNDCNGVIDDAPECPCLPATIDAVEFQICRYKLSWNDARAVCQAAGGDLATIDDFEQNFQLWQQARTTGIQGLFIGLNDLDEEGVFTWSDGSAPSFTHFNVGEPNDFQMSEDCGELRTQTDARWNDQNCNIARAFICRESSSLSEIETAGNDD